MLPSTFINNPKEMTKADNSTQCQDNGVDTLRKPIGFSMHINE